MVIKGELLGVPVAQHTAARARRDVNIEFGCNNLDTYELQRTSTCMGIDMSPMNESPCRYSLQYCAAGWHFAIITALHLALHPKLNTTDASRYTYTVHTTSQYPPMQHQTLPQIQTKHQTLLPQASSQAEVPMKKSRCIPEVQGEEHCDLSIGKPREMKSIAKKCIILKAP